jgi:hypothetical protein
MENRKMPYSRFFLLTTLSSAIISSPLLFLLNFIFGEDRAGVLASVLHLGNGVILAALLGGFTGLWLALGGPKRAARLAGTMIGIVVVWALWSNGGKYLWIIESFLLGVFGKEGAAYTGLVATMILFGAMGQTTQLSAGLIEAVIRRVRPKPPEQLAAKSGQATPA